MKTAIHPDAARRLKEIIEEDGLSYTDVANRVGMHHSSVSNYAGAKSPIKPAFLILAETKLGWSKKWIETGQGSKKLESNSFHKSFNIDTNGFQNTSQAVYGGEAISGQNPGQTTEREKELMARELELSRQLLKSQEEVIRLLKEQNGQNG